MPRRVGAWTDYISRVFRRTEEGAGAGTAAEPGTAAAVEPGTAAAAAAEPGTAAAAEAEAAAAAAAEAEAEPEPEAGAPAPARPGEFLERHRDALKNALHDSIRTHWQNNPADNECNTEKWETFERQINAAQTVAESIRAATNYYTDCNVPEDANITNDLLLLLDPSNAITYEEFGRHFNRTREEMRTHTNELSESVRRAQERLDSFRTTKGDKELHEAEMRTQQAYSEQYTEQIRLTQIHITALDEQIAELSAEKLERETEVADLTAQNATSTATIAGLNTQIRELEALMGDDTEEGLQRIIDDRTAERQQYNSHYAFLMSLYGLLRNYVSGPAS